MTAESITKVAEQEFLAISIYLKSGNNSVSTHKDEKRFVELEELLKEHGLSGGFGHLIAINAFVRRLLPLQTMMHLFPDGKSTITCNIAST